MRGFSKRAPQCNRPPGPGVLGGHGAESDFADFYAATWSRTLAVTYALTYDYGTPGGRGALWLAAHGDRAGVIGVDGVDRPLPVGVAGDVAEVLHTYLQLPWE